MNTLILDEWWQTGRLRVEHPLSCSTDQTSNKSSLTSFGTESSNDEQLIQWIVQNEALYRKHLPSKPPALSIPDAIWAVTQFYRASQLLIFRELGDEFVRSGLELYRAAVHRDKISDLASVHYSVDLSFRFLPDLYRLAKAAMANTADDSDSLIEFLRAWGECWPLAWGSVSREEFAKVGDLWTIPKSAEPIVYDPCLRILYTERILGTDPLPTNVEAWSRILERQFAHA